MIELLLAACLTTGTLQTPELLKLVPRGTLTADVIQPLYSARFRELNGKLQSAIQQDAQWWAEHIKTAQTGQPLAYHPKMRISEAEYAEFIAEGSNLQLGKAREIPMEVAEITPTRFRFSWPSQPQLGDIELDVAKGSVTTPVGECVGFKPATAKGRAPSAQWWTGLECRYLAMDSVTLSGKSIGFALARLDESGRGVLWYDLKESKDSRAARTPISLLLYYDLPK